MKIRYYLMGAALVAMSSMSLTSCSDDDEPQPQPQPVETEAELTFAADVYKVKIGPENRMALPSAIVDGAGDYNAYSLDPSVADVVEDEQGNVFIEGFKNGYTSVVVSDAAGTYKRLGVSVYTTDVMALSHSKFDFTVPMGRSVSSTECSVVEGNGEYVISVAPDDGKIRATIDAETGKISITATAGKEEVTYKLTVTDASNLTASIDVTVVPTFDAFIQSEIDAIIAETGNMVDYNDDYPYTFYYFLNGYSGYGEMGLDIADGVSTVGWACDYGYGSYIYYYYAVKISYPEGTALNTEVDGSMIYGSGNGYQEKPKTYPGTVKIVADDSEKIVVLWWNVDKEAETIDRGYVRWMKE